MPFAVGGARRKLGAVRATLSAEKGLDFFVTCLDKMRCLFDQAICGKPCSGRKQRAAHDTARPDVAVKSAFVTQPRHQAYLFKKFIEIGAVFCWNLFPQSGHVCFGNNPSLSCALFDSNPDPGEGASGTSIAEGSPVSRLLSSRLPTTPR